MGVYRERKNKTTDDREYGEIFIIYQWKEKHKMKRINWRKYDILCADIRAQNDGEKV